MASEEFRKLLSMLFKSHPWHGVSPGERAPHVVRSYVEIVPTEAVKLELDKATGHLHVDRPQRFSSMCPTLYGYIPLTYCGEEIAKRCMQRTKLRRVEGDGDPLDICVLTEKDFAHGDLLLQARPIGGLRMVDKAGSKPSQKGSSPYQADDKIIAVLENDATYGDITDISECPPAVIERLKHYFESYKRAPGDNAKKPTVQIMEVYGRDEAQRVIRAAQADYLADYGTQEQRLDRLYELLCKGLMEKLLADDADPALLVKILQKAAQSGALSKVLGGNVGPARKLPGKPSGKRKPAPARKRAGTPRAKSKK